VHVHSWDDADSECVLYVGLDGKGAVCIGNVQIHSLTHIQTLSFIY